MSKIYAPKSIDLSSFQLPDEKLQTKYGLPHKVEFCKSCVISNQRPNSAVEYEHKKESKNIPSILMTKAFVMPVELPNAKNLLLIGKSETGN